jgi:ABC-type Zn uptake system ZnuABC Zn-binding protein ZnuA
METLVTGPCRALRLDIIRMLVVFALGGALVAACDAGSGGGQDGVGATKVVATTTVLADMVRQVGGDHVDVASLVPPGGEVHTFDPTPSDLSRVADARLIVMNGLGLDDWLGQVATNSGTTAEILELGQDLDGVDYLRAADDHAEEDVNPHLWLNVAYGIKYVERIGEALARADPDNAEAYAAGTRAYSARLAELETWARDQIAAIPESSRTIVSFHEAFPYFAEAYGLEIVGTIVDAPGQDPSAGEIADLVEAIRASGAKAIFSEAQFSPELADTVAREAGITIESNLYNDSLGDPPADSYEGIIRWDVERVVAALTR